MGVYECPGSVIECVACLDAGYRTEVVSTITDPTEFEEYVAALGWTNVTVGPQPCDWYEIAGVCPAH